MPSKHCNLTIEENMTSWFRDPTPATTNVSFPISFLKVGFWQNSVSYQQPQENFNPLRNLSLPNHPVRCFFQGSSPIFIHWFDSKIFLFDIQIGLSSDLETQTLLQILTQSSRSSYPLPTNLLLKVKELKLDDRTE